MQLGRDDDRDDETHVFSVTYFLIVDCKLLPVNLVEETLVLLTRHEHTRLEHKDLDDENIAGWMKDEFTKVP